MTTSIQTEPERTTVSDYVVCIPSKGRVGNMARMLSMFPAAHVYVDAVEEADYAEAVPVGQLFTHPGLPGQFHIWKYMLAHEQAECVLLIDDDLEFVASHVMTYPKIRRFTDAESLRRIVETGVNILCDLNLSLYGWKRMAHPGSTNLINPISLTGSITGALLVRGRDLEVDVDTDCCDLDMTMQALLKHRVLIKDMRYYWNFGVAGSGGGGSQGTHAMADITHSRQVMLKKWGRYLCIGNLPTTSRMRGGGAGAGGTAQNFGHTVSRRSSLVSP